MIRKLTESDKKLVLEFAYQREMESQFVLGSFKSYKNSLSDNYFWGYFKNGQLIGMASIFSRWNNLVVQSLKKEVIEDLVDEVVKSGRKIEYVSYFKKFAEVIIERLKKYGLEPKKYDEQIFFTLKKDDFVDYSKGEAGLLMSEDLDEYIKMAREANDENVEAPIKEIERKRVNLELTFVLKIEGKIVSRAYLQGMSKNFFQIGGVVTKKAERGKGYAKRVISSLCKNFFEKEIGTAILYVDKDNIAALKVYEAIGFKKVGEYLTAEY